jgi:hypothetical protein
MKSAFDGARYAAGATDSFQGTGVWSGIKLNRNTSGAAKKPESKAAKKPQKVKLGKGK